MSNEKSASDATKKALDEEGPSPYPDMALCQKIHVITTSNSSDTMELQAEVFQTIITELENPSLYQKLQTLLHPSSFNSLIASSKLTSDDLKNLENKHETTLKELEEKVEQAKIQAGDMEVMRARMDVACFASKSLSEDQALLFWKNVVDFSKISSGKKVDALMESARVASFYGSTSKADELIEQAQKLANEGGGGDWDRRNRLKVYKALQSLLHRDLETAATLLLDCVATFSCAEICSYSDFIVYAILSNLLYLPRPDLKKKIIDGPEILSVAKEIPSVVSVIHRVQQGLDTSLQ
jgi:hypothetical protein